MYARVDSGITLPKSGIKVLNPDTKGALCHTASSNFPSISGGVSTRSGFNGSFARRVAVTVKKKTAAENTPHKTVDVIARFLTIIEGYANGAMQVLLCHWKASLSESERDSALLKQHHGRRLQTAHGLPETECDIQRFFE